MRASEPLAASWKAQLDLQFSAHREKTLLTGKRAEGPLVVQKPLYPEGEGLCHAIVVHPPGGIAGGDDLQLSVTTSGESSVLLTTPGAGRWYRSAGPWARQALSFEVQGRLEWLPRETIVFDGALASLESHVSLSENASYLGWEIICLGRSGSGEGFRNGSLRLETKVTRAGKPLLLERGRVNGGGRLLVSPAGMGGRSVFATLLAASNGLDQEILASCRKAAGQCVALTLLPGLLVARYLGDSSEAAMSEFVRLWKILRPALLGRAALEPRIWST